MFEILLIVIVSMVGGFVLSEALARRAKYNFRVSPFVEDAVPEAFSAEESMETHDISRSLDATTGGNWYVEQDEKRWKLKAAHLDGGTDYVIISVNKSETARVMGDVWPTLDDAKFIEYAKNAYVPALLDIVDVLEAEREQMAIMIEEALPKLHHTKEDYKALLMQLLQQLTEVEENE